MKILVVSDHEEVGLWDYFLPEKVAGVDLIISCGDLKPDYLEFLATMVNRPLIYVRGNHDGIYDSRPPEGCINIDGKTYDFNGLKIYGLGGSYRYKDGGDMYSERQMRSKIILSKMNLSLRNNIDILVTHVACKGYGDMEDLAHQGFDCFNDLLNQYKPKYMLHGHVHKEYGKFNREIIHPSGTKIINAHGHVIIDI